MITNFENQTYALTDKELSMIDSLVEYLKLATGEENHVTASSLSKMYGVSGPRIRKMIHYIRTNNLLLGLVAKSNGYYVTNDLVDLLKYERSLSERIASIEEVRKALASHINNILYEVEWSAEKNLAE